MTDHYIISYHYPATHGDYPAPSETSYECACGAELGVDMYPFTTDADANFADHLAEIGDTNA